MLNRMIQGLETRTLFAIAGINFDVAPNEYGAIVLIVETTGNKADLVTVKQLTHFEGDVQNVRVFVELNGELKIYTHKSTGANNQLVTVLVKTGRGNDRIHALNYDNVRKGSPMLMVEAGTGNDVILCESGFVIADGGAGNDTLIGRTHIPTTDGNLAFSFAGGRGNDTLIGSNFKDALNGGDGDDYFQFGQGKDMADGGAGNDYFVKGFDDMSRSIIKGGIDEDTLAVFTGDKNMPLDNTFSRLRISDVEIRTIDKRG